MYISSEKYIIFAISLLALDLIWFV